MELTRPSPLATNGLSELSSAQVAKAALRRLVAERLEPTPQNYERAFRLESGDIGWADPLPPRARKTLEHLALRAFDGDDTATALEIAEAFSAGRFEQAASLLEGCESRASDALATLMERIVRGMERSGRQWTPARRREAMARVINASRSDSRRLQQRLQQLVTSWDTDAAAGAESVFAALPIAEPRSPGDGPLHPQPEARAAAEGERTPDARDGIIRALLNVAAQGLPDHDGAPHELAEELQRFGERLTVGESANTVAPELASIVPRVERVFQHRHHLFDQLNKLCLELTASLTELAEDDSWVKGQCEAMRSKVEEGLTARGVRAVSDLLHDTRLRHASVRGERHRARDALKGLITQMLSELDELGAKTGNFHQSVGRYAAVIEESDSLESLTGVVREMVAESRSVQSLVQQTQARLQEEHNKASGLSLRVNQLEDEMRRLSDEVSTDQLTQVANRRGLMQAFEIERARLERDGGHLSVGLLDIDNFKRLNDELGHSAGDEALKSLAAAVSNTLRPTDRRGALRWRGVRRPPAGHARRRGRADPDPRAALADQRPVPAQGQAGLRDLLGRGDGLPLRRDHRGSARARRPGALRGQANGEEPDLHRLTSATAQEPSENSVSGSASSAVARCTSRSNALMVASGAVEFINAVRNAVDSLS